MDKERSLKSRRSNTHFLTEKYAFLILIVLYAVGTVAFALKIHPEFSRLTPLNLVISAAFALYFHQNWSSRMYFFAAACAVFGFTIEMIGVNTGLIFGHYTYDFALGVEIFNTPLSISVNWLLTTYCAATTVFYFLPQNNRWLNALIAAVLMVILDVLIEPVAMKTGMWSWENDIVPLKNYIGWFLTALPLQLIFFGFQLGERNKVAVLLLFLQFIFFAVLGLLL